MAAGVQDSKAISSDARIRQLADAIRHTPGIATEVISMGPERYNDLYGKFKNLNRLLAWGHSRVIESLLEQRPDCPRSLSDQFAHESVLRRAIGPRAKDSGMILEQRTKGESDVAVAAASILARERFIDWMDEASRRLGVKLPRGASQVKGVAGQLVAARGAEFLAKVAKTHFKTARQVLGMPRVQGGNASLALANLSHSPGNPPFRHDHPYPPACRASGLPLVRRRADIFRRGSTQS